MASSTTKTDAPAGPAAGVEALDRLKRAAEDVRGYRYMYDGYGMHSIQDADGLAVAVIEPLHDIADWLTFLNLCTPDAVLTALTAPVPADQGGSALAESAPAPQEVWPADAEPRWIEWQPGMQMPTGQVRIREEQGDGSFWESTTYGDPYGWVGWREDEWSAGKIVAYLPEGVAPLGGVHEGKLRDELSPPAIAPAGVVEALEQLINEIVSLEEHGDGADDVDCPVCVAIANGQRALASISPRGEGVEPWRPIETAPRDGTWFLAACGECVDRMVALLERNTRRGRNGAYITDIHAFAEKLAALVSAGAKL